MDYNGNMCLPSPLLPTSSSSYVLIVSSVFTNEACRACTCDSFIIPFRDKVGIDYLLLFTNLMASITSLFV